MVGHPEQGTKPKCPGPIKAYHVETGAVRWLPCRRRVCVVCGPVYWRPSKLAALHSGLREGDFLALLLTAPGTRPGPGKSVLDDGTLDVDAWNEGAAKRWHRFFHRMRRRYRGARLDFWRVGEVQERGAVHYHVVMRGLRWLDIEKFREDAVAVGFGPWVGVRRPRDYRGGVHSLGWYFGKYLLKSYQGHAVGRLVTMSLGWKVDWKRRVREGPGRWLVVFGPWARVGYQAWAGPEGASEEWFPRWWRGSWQRARKREAPPLDWLVTGLGWPAGPAVG